jgi:hypothetical protein
MYTFRLGGTAQRLKGSSSDYYEAMAASQEKLLLTSCGAIRLLIAR